MSEITQAVGAPLERHVRPPFENAYGVPLRGFESAQGGLYKGEHVALEVSAPDGLVAHEPTPTPGPAGASAKKAKAGAGKKGGEPGGQAKAEDPTAGGAGGDQMDGAGDAGDPCAMTSAQLDAFAEAES